jgi:hypothetical protein
LASVGFDLGGDAFVAGVIENGSREFRLAYKR